MLHAGAITKSELNERLRQFSMPLFNPEWIVDDHMYMQTVAWEWIETSDEANAALASLPRDAHTEFDDATLGVVYQLAGKSGSAVPALRRARSTCSGLAWPRQYIRLNWFLGQALEETGDIPGACAAYQSVLDRWESAKPKSVTADRSRARMSAINCVPSSRTPEVR
jgi:hypothetical protein